MFRPTLEALEDRITPTGSGWVIPTGNGATNWGMAIDDNNNSVLTGYFTNTANFGSTSLTSAGGMDGCVSKYDPNGSLLWAKSFGGSGADNATRVATDASGNIYVAGYISGTVTFSPTITTTSAGGSDAILAKLDPSGNVLWVSQLGGTSTDESWSVAVDSSSNVYATGRFNGSASISLNGAATGVTLTPTGNQGQDAFVLKLDSAGNPIWARNIGSSGSDDWGIGVTVDPNQNVYATGRFSGTASFGNITLTGKNTGGLDAYVTRLDSSGNFQWAQRMGGAGFNGNQGGYAIAVDARSTDPSTWAVYVTGVMDGSNCDFGSTTFTSRGDDDAFVTKLDAATGSFTWADQLAGAGQEIPYALALDGAGNVYTAGQFGANNQPANFDPHGTFIMYTGNGSPASGDREAYVSMLDPTGYFVGAWQTKSSANGAGAFGIAVSSAGDVWSSGSFSSVTTFFTGQTLTPSPAGSSMLFLVRMNAPHGAVVGTVYADLNQNGTRDGEPPLIGSTVYADLNNNGVFDTGEPSALTDSNGRYEIDGLAAGTYTIRPVLPAGWTTTTPAGGAYTVTVGNGFARNKDFGEYTPTIQTTYTQSKAVSINRNSTAQSTLSVSDSYSILDVNVQVNISFPVDGALILYLIAPDGTSYTLAKLNGSNGSNFTNTIFDDQAATSINSGTAPFSGSYQPYVPLVSLQGKNVHGTWTLQVQNTGLQTGKLNSWSLIVMHTKNGNPLTAMATSTLSPKATTGGATSRVAAGALTLASPSSPSQQTVTAGTAVGLAVPQLAWLDQMWHSLTDLSLQFILDQMSMEKQLFLLGAAAHDWSWLLDVMHSKHS